MIKVSVVVPVYNPGEYISACVESLVSQSMSSDEYEVIFVDDGSTDETPALLDRLAAEHSHITTIHQPNSGWPGKPRNVGIEAATGEYVYFCDNDDWLGHEALERMYAYATAQRSDVLLGKMAGLNRSVPQRVFDRDRPKATLDNTPLMDSLTPHKLFRRAFLNEHGIRFPEGRRRLEDHFFVVSAYLLATTISVYADYTCYYHIKRDDASNAGFSAIDWPAYFTNLAEALDVVVAHTMPGAYRDGIYRRWLQNEMVNRLVGRRFSRLDPAEAERLFAAAHTVAARYFGEGVVLRLPAGSRGVARALLAGDLGRVRALAEAEAGWQLTSRLLQVAWVGPALQISGLAAFRDDGVPPGSGVSASTLFDGLTPQECAAGVSTSTLTLDLTERRTGQRWPVPTAVERHGLTTAFTADLDPSRLAAGSPLPDGIWDLYVELTLLGVRRRQRLTLVPRRLPTGPLLGGPDGSGTAAYLTQNNHGLTLDVGLLYHRDLARSVAAATPDPEPRPEPVEDAVPETGPSIQALAAQPGGQDLPELLGQTYRAVVPVSVRARLRTARRGPKR